MNLLPAKTTFIPTAAVGKPQRVVVIGGGLAGMSAAVALASAGCQVTLLEARKTLGGRAGSYTHPATGETLDNCQHVLLGCCTNLIDFYRRCGVADQIEFSRTVTFVESDGTRHTLGGARGLPAPLHLGPALLRFGLLNLSEKKALTRAMLAMLKLGRAGRKRLADVPFGDWLDEHKQPESLVKKVYDPLLIGSLNEQTRRASAEYAVQVFQDSLLSHAGGYPVGVPTGPLDGLYANLPGVDVRRGARVAELIHSENRLTAVRLTDGEALPADAVVLAVHPQAAGRLVPASLRQTDRRFDHLDELEPVPILGVHLTFDRPVLDVPHVALIDGPLQWLFRKDSRGKVLHGVISAAREFAGRPAEELLPTFEAQIRRTFPAAREAVLERGEVVVEKRATFAPVPGVDRLRPTQAPGEGGIENLFLAGDYTKTGWPATMEGAARSGYLAAGEIAGAGFLIDDLPTQWSARLIGM